MVTHGATTAVVAMAVGQCVPAQGWRHEFSDKGSRKGLGRGSRLGLMVVVAFVPLTAARFRVCRKLERGDHYG